MYRYDVRLVGDWSREDTDADELDMAKNVISGGYPWVKPVVLGIMYGRLTVTKGERPRGETSRDVTGKFYVDVRVYLPGTPHKDAVIEYAVKVLELFAEAAFCRGPELRVTSAKVRRPKYVLPHSAVSTFEEAYSV